MAKIVITGGAGFIGSCLLSWFNSHGHKDIIVVDHWDAEGLKKLNLQGKEYEAYYDKEDFLKQVISGKGPKGIEYIFHMGACSSTMGQDRGYYLRNNFEYSCHMAHWSIETGARFIYASSAATYGNGENGYTADRFSILPCRPLNYYGESKQLFDEWVLHNNLYDRIVGLKFFNVFGPNEYHKGDMRSVIAKAYDRVMAERKMILFKSHQEGYSDGEQKRDFVYVKDVIDVIIFFMQNPAVNGIFNVGTGVARTWNDLARALFSAVGILPVIEYVDMPESLRSKYQYFTQADMGNLYKAGFTRPFMTLEDSVADYVNYLKCRTIL